ncbi:MAG: hypothetical protein GF330_00365 [Candidatus Eisenbacteria bacterium]|nr:hypothetical protein [Candidatus Eisenbacteria bacterium]
MTAEVAGDKHSHRGRGPLRRSAPAFLSVALSLAGVTPASSEAIRLEAEDHVAFDDQGSPVFGIVEDGHASGGAAVEGMRIGAWIEIELSLPEDVCFRDSLRSAGDHMLVRTYDVTFTPAGAGEPIVAERIVTPPGSGAG